MHIPENYLSPETCAALTAAMAPVWYAAARRVKAQTPPDRLPLLGVGAAFSFLGMMLNVPLPGGTTGHAVGGVLLAAVFGPWAACLALTVTLFIQALFFGDGGLIALGANAFNMAFVLPFAGYAVYALTRRFVPERRGMLLGAALGGYIGINAAALCAAVEFGVQPLLFRDAAGQALYCPYPLSISVPAMMLGHLTLFGLAEAVFSAAALSYLLRAAPTLFEARPVASSRPVYALAALLIAAAPLGLLAEGTAWGEWSVEEIAQLTEDGAPLGYKPSGMAEGFSFDALFPDYAVAGLPEAFGYVVSAAIGTALLVIAFKLAALAFGGRADWDCGGA